MEYYQRGRQTSTGNDSNNIKHSPSPHTLYNTHHPQPAVDSSFVQATELNNTAIPPQAYHQQSSFDTSQFSATTYENDQQYQLDPFNHSDHNQLGSFDNQFMNNGQGDHLAFNAFDTQATFSDQNNFDPSLQDYQAQRPLNSATDPFEDFVNFDPNTTTNQLEYSDMSALQRHSGDMSHLLRPDLQNSSAHSSPALYQDAFPSMPQQQQQHLHHNHNHHHSRNTSLDPSSAAYPHGANFVTHRGHMRTPSERSDVSSNHASPYLGGASDSFEPVAGDPSPMLNGSQDNSVFGPDALGLGSFSLSEGQYISPGHSSHPSPYLGPQHVQQLFDPQDSFDVLNNDHFQNGQIQESFPVPEPFPALQHSESQGDVGQADQMSPPEIRFDPAPPSKQPSYSDLSEMRMTADFSGGGLSLPSKRPRAISAPYLDSSGQASPARSRSPSLGLHPGDIVGNRARSQSPSGPANGIRKNYGRRASSPQVPSNHTRERVVEMASQAVNRSSPQPSEASGSPGSTSGLDGAGSPDLNSNSNDGQGLKRSQKHPATFECHLCPKRFTRAYNLRSHLRTHTDERPFVCTVCGKAFARQHDRKRHEGLHSGEKKFVCRGLLSESTPNVPANQWGCGRRFARADALGRHFRSEAGRACIKPLLDEEARARQEEQAEQRYNQQVLHAASAAQLGQAASMMAIPQPMPQEIQQEDPVDYNSLPLPAVLLAQFPALRDIQWNAPPGHAITGQGNTDYDGSDYDDGNISGGRSSFEASSGGEWDEGNTGYGGVQGQQGVDSSFQRQQQHNQQWSHGGWGR